MKGCQPLSPSEYRAVLAACPENPFGYRDRALISLGCHTGLRISELLSLDIGDAFPNRRAASRIVLKRRYTKGQHNGRIVLVPEPPRQAIAEWIALWPPYVPLSPDSPLFISRHGSRLSRRQALDRLKEIFIAAQLPEPHGSHTLRKTFAKAVFEGSGRDLITTQQALGHASLASTACYLAPNHDSYTALLSRLNLTDN